MRCKVSMKFSMRLKTAQTKGQPCLSQAHNRRSKEQLRDDWNKDGHVDEQLSHLNEQLIAEDWNLDDFLANELTDKILQHNEKCIKQRHKERCVEAKDIIAEATGSAQEVILQLGDTTEFQELVGLRGIDEARRIHGEFLKASLKWWQETNPQYKVFNAIIHFDEAVPHLHLDFVPICSSKQLGYIVSRRGALRDMGFKSDSETVQKSAFMYDRWNKLEQMAAENTPDFVEIEPSEPNLSDGLNPPEWRKQKWLEGQISEYVTQYLSNIPPEPPLYVAQEYPPQEDEPIRYQGEGLLDYNKRHKEWKDYPKRKAEFDNAEQAKVEASKAARSAWEEQYQFAASIKQQALINAEDKANLDKERDRIRRQEAKARKKNAEKEAQLLKWESRLEQRDSQLDQRDNQLDQRERTLELSIAIENGHRKALKQPIDNEQIACLVADTLRGFTQEHTNEQEVVGKENTNVGNEQHNSSGLYKHDTYDLGR